jgi:uncharacterized protein (TIGR02646 family)
MRSIAKRREPRSLAEHRSRPGATYDDFPGKQELRESLCAEQRGQCAFCLSRIRPAVGAMKIAHCRSQSTHPGERLDYGNLVGACMGGEGSPPDRQHCDTHQGERDVTRNPADPAHQVERSLHYPGDGRLVSDDPEFDAELNEVLNLNVAFLRNNRKAALDAFKVTLGARPLQVPALERLLRQWNGDSPADALEPYCQAIVYWLRKRIARAPAT